MALQIDVKRGLTMQGIDFVECNLYTGENCVKMYIHKKDYNELIRDGFFIRDGKNVDSANVLNTTVVYEKVNS